jgi:RNA polymerase sigma factor (sigma-70 family)
MQAVFNEFTRENRHKRGADLSAVSLNTCTHAIDREGDELQDFVVDPHAEFEGGAVARVQVERYCSILDERERTVLRMVSRGSPYIEIGRSLGVTKQRINQLHQRALKKIREVYWRDFQN